MELMQPSFHERWYPYKKYPVHSFLYIAMAEMYELNYWRKAIWARQSPQLAQTKKGPKSDL